MSSQEETNTAGLKVFWLTLASGLCFVLSFFPFGFGWLGWLAPMGVLKVISLENLPGKRPKTQIWLACFLCWLALFQCVRLPHWAGYIGWPILAAYLCTYLFGFVMVTRCFVHRWRIPLLLAAPVVWTGLEYVQAHFCTGISLGMLPHTQANFSQVIQVADLAGCYTISFFMVAIAAGLFVGTESLCCGPRNLKLATFGLLQAVLLLIFMLGYGWSRLEDADAKTTNLDLRIALIQGSIDTRFPDASEIDEYLDSFTRHYTELTLEACQEEVDLVIWPESMFPVPDAYPADQNLSDDLKQRTEQASYGLLVTAHVVTNSGRIDPSPAGPKFTRIKPAVPLLVGANSMPVGGDYAFYNSGILISDEGKVVSRYGKMKLVLFGEFVPLGDVFPWLYNFFPIPPGLKAWDRPVGMELEGFTFSPSICFESTYPHLMRKHVNQLDQDGKKPDMFVNLSNDGWFYGSTALDMHFANNVLRAVENRTPMLIAANTGFSGQIDSGGRVVHKGPRRQPQVLYVNAMASDQTSLYRTIGDWPAFLCFLAVLPCFLSWFFALFFRKKLELTEQSRATDPEVSS